MAKLEGVKTLDMVNGEITKVEYNGEVYERVGKKGGKEGDIGLRIRRNAYYVNIGEYYPITINRGNLAFKDDIGQNPYIHEELENFAYFRKPSAPSLKVGDKVRLISENPEYGFGLTRVGDVGEVRKVTGEDVVVDFPNHTNWNGIMADLELVEEAQPTKELFAKVNRPNNVPIPGDYVEFRDDIAEDCSAFLTVGKKYEVERVDAFGGADITDDNGDFESADTDETKAIYVKYTQEQAEREPEVGDKVLVVDAKETGGNYGNGDILTVRLSSSVGVFVEEFARGLRNEEYIVLNPEQVGEDNSEEDSEDLPVGTKVRGKGSGITYTLYGRSPEYDDRYGKAYYTTENKFGWMGEEQFDVISKPEPIEVGDLVQVVDSPSALPNGSYFVVKGVSEDGSTLRGVRPNSVFDIDYRYAVKHVKLIAKAGEGEGDRFYG